MYAFPIRSSGTLSSSHLLLFTSLHSRLLTFFGAPSDARNNFNNTFLLRCTRVFPCVNSLSLPVCVSLYFSLFHPIWRLTGLKLIMLHRVTVFLQCRALAALRLHIPTHNLVQQFLSISIPLHTVYNLALSITLLGLNAMPHVTISSTFPRRRWLLTLQR